VDTKESIIDIFAAFLLLSYSKLLFASCFLLLGTKIYNADGKLVPGTSHVLLVDATVQFLSKEHLPFAITAFLILVFTLLPPMQICKRNQAEDELSDADQLPHRLVNPNQYNKTLLSVSE